MSNLRSRRAYTLLAQTGDAGPRRSRGYLTYGFWLRVAVLFILSVPIVAEAMDADPGTDATFDLAEPTAAATRSDESAERLVAGGPKQDQPSAPAAVPVELVSSSASVAKGYAEVAFIPEPTTTTEAPIEKPVEVSSPPVAVRSTSQPAEVSQPPAGPPITIVAPAEDGPGEPLGRFRVTCYTLGGTTASGAPVAEDGIAVDPGIIPLGSRVYVDGLGWKVARDTGPGIQGHAIDIWNPSGSYCASWGHQYREVWLG